MQPTASRARFSRFQHSDAARSRRLTRNTLAGLINVTAIFNMSERVVESLHKAYARATLLSFKHHHDIWCSFYSPRTSMYTYKTEPWSNIVATYEMFLSNGWQIQPMLDLTRFLAISPYASGLFPLTSMATLRIGRYPDFLPGDGELIIELAPSRQMFIFTYQSQPARAAEWQHQYPIAEGMIAIKRFLYTYARWFSGPKNSERV